VSIKAVEDATRVSDWEWQMDDFTEGAAIPGFGGEDSPGKVIFYLDDVDVVGRVTVAAGRVLVAVVTVVGRVTV
jgi:hypothetical protein